MLKYLVESTEQLAALAIMAGMLLAYIRIAYQGRAAFIMRIGFIAGIVSAIVMSVTKTMTSKVDTGIWNLYIYTVSLAVLALFFVFTFLGKRLKKQAEYLPAVMLATELAMLFLYFLPAFFEMPHTILLTEETVMSTAFIVKFLGMLLGFLLIIIMGISVYQGMVYMGKNTALVLTSSVLLINALKQVASAFGILLAKRLIASSHTLFVISKYASNLSVWFIYMTILVAVVVPVILLIRSYSANEPYENNAQRRKIIAKWRKLRRFSGLGILCFAFVICIMTAVNAYANKEVELSPIEEAKIDGDNFTIPFDQVNDGHLHRFGYTTDNDVVIRFIIIQKPNSASYGIGLDACEICGETGYYEKNGQVVCNLCDVIMNINTIGFKGGCNPIPIDYRIENGNIVVPVERLLEHESEFK
ncbi:Fe-S-containing protein [Lacrimispora indolis]|uniref:Fe-S-containing protein n=1 Tax=Lacrimispora indolis TaxID=69825 RepID=UPI000420D234|nr:Fe-S-containing protein [[Clostridium] methoxybenzovorans]